MSIIDGLSKAIVHCDDSCDRAVLVDARYILDKLPKTADGEPIVPEMQVWRNRWPTTLGEKVRAVNGKGEVWLYGLGSMYFADQLSSSYEAAKAAGEE